MGFCDLALHAKGHNCGDKVVPVACTCALLCQLCLGFLGSRRE